MKSSLYRMKIPHMLGDNRRHIHVCINIYMQNALNYLTHLDNYDNVLDMSYPYVRNGHFQSFTKPSNSPNYELYQNN